MNIRKYAPAAAVVLLALVASGLGIFNDFTYDDRYVVLANTFVHHLGQWWRVFGTSYWPKAWTGDGYRPLTILAFMIEWAIGGGSPMVFHAANILLYVAVALLVYRFALLILPAGPAWVAAALFAVHPVHVEAVANVVGQSELLVAVAVLAASILYIRARRAGTLSPRTALAVVLLYAVAMLSKEHGIVLPAILLAAELTVLDDGSPIRERARQLRPFYLVLLACAVAFLGARSLVLSGHNVGGFELFTPFSSLKISAPDRVLTAISVVPQWVRLLLWPAHLSSEYGPPALEIAQGLSITQLPGLLLLVGIVTLGVILRRRRPELSFAVAIVCLALLPSSNFILPAGILLAERTLFLASVGAVLAIGGIAAIVLERIRDGSVDTRRTMLWLRTAGALLVVAGAARSASRTTVWKNNSTLFHQAVLDAPDAYRAHFMLGAMSFESGDRKTGEEEDHKALRLFPYDPSLTFTLAEQYRLAGLCEPALPLYKWTLTLDRDYPTGRTQYAMCLANVGRLDEAKHWALEAVSAGSNLPLLHYVLAVIDSAKRTESNTAKPAAGVPVQTGRKVPDAMQKAAR